MNLPRPRRRGALLLSAAVLLPTLTGCAGGSPLLHPARTLPKGDVRVLGGTSAVFAGGDLSGAIDGAREQAAQNAGVPGPPGSDPVYARGALVAAAVAPGLAPFIAARSGLGSAFEAGISYTGRSIRIDARRSFSLSSSSDFSVGLGGSAPLYGREPGDLPDVDLSKLRGYGLDVPLLVGWESEAGLYKVWGGARGGWDHVILQNMTTDPRPGLSDAIELEADRWYVGGVVGLAVGFRRVHVGLELGASYQSVVGVYNATRERVMGFILVPASAISYEF